MYKDFQQPLVHLPVAASSRRSKRSTIDKKNVTGLFLAAEGNIEPKKPISVPPLARSRLVYRRPKTPSEERSQKLVDYYRGNELKIRSGFVGNRLKKRQQQKSSTIDQSREWTPCAIDEEYWEIPALRNRCSTAPAADDDDSIDYKKELKGLMDCYQKVCGVTLSTLSSLQTLLPRKRSQSRPADHNKDFLSIRSFQSPSQAEIMAIFPPQVTARPKTYPYGPLRPLSTAQGTFYSVKDSHGNSKKHPSEQTQQQKEKQTEANPADRAPCNTEEPSSTPKEKIKPPMIRQMSGAEIAFNLKDEKGDVVPVEIDGIEEEVCERTPTPEKKVSIQQRVLKARNSEQQMSIIAASRENRKQEWVELLDEHAQIVNEVNCLEGVGDKENIINGPSDGAAQIS